ncbi:uncharacterized protein L969DRAFT_45192 [Mixia osmundae IAM 14324]|uniref:Nudix hydrolase domain-containing protein n=1 Tax=Mixia osmundae (strain CBS 9802 / IAM 14324 / JCM 22182 / KY 12970) TaxID=764103 RepID=G7DYN2_MIXOS|nr:uncharacterized protein L969DRAFT_45192 [Mixia osmundae IAM 14324]KEI41591.1 hypothetical protein L969DRAFT_45192 [Mixia osmundae IAM 14324]GAA95692.1 hypothetical protein E5Q_02349 [Mixia osmundae IAM 14324]
MGDALLGFLSQYELSSQPVQCLHRLAALGHSIDHVDLPRRKVAAVAVLLYADQEDELSVVLTTRAKTLRSHPGETALPGGRQDPEDASIQVTALREANEEVALPFDPERMLALATLPAFVSRNLLFVKPVVYLIDAALVALLKPNPGEVDAIFSCKLAAFLGNDKEAGDAIQLEHSHNDMIWLLDRPFRLHAFRHTSLPSAVTGLTADILIATALCAYDAKSTTFEQRPAGQPDWPEMVEAVLAGLAGAGNDQRTRMT